MGHINTTETPGVDPVIASRQEATHRNVFDLFERGMGNVAYLGGRAVHGIGHMIKRGVDGLLNH